MAAEAGELEGRDESAALLQDGYGGDPRERVGEDLLDAAAAENRDLNAEEQEKYDRISGELDSRAAIIEQLKADEERAARLDAVAAEVRTDEAPAGDDGDAEAIRALARGEVRSYNFEKRDVQTSSTGAPVPTKL